jgi:two-component system, LytTR family, response regulator
MIQNRIILKSDGQILFIRQEEIDWLECEGNLVRLHSKNECRLIKAQMNQLEEALDPENFFRLNRSAIVNLDFIREMEPALHGTYRTVLKDGTELILSRNYRERLFAQISAGVRFLSIAK